MADKQRINEFHGVDSICLDYCALAAVGLEQNRSIATQDRLFAVVQGSPQWQGSNPNQVNPDRSPAQVVLNAYREKGIGFLQDISGPFVLGLVDEANRRSIIAIDRLGINSLFYSLRRNQLLFASNARALRPHPDAGGEIDAQAVFDYLYFHNVPSPRCIYQDVEKLLPGQYLIHENDEIRKGFYWRPDYAEAANPSLEGLTSEFRSIVEASVARAMTDEKLGAFLSGGTDSSTIAGMLGRLGKSPADTYTIGFQAEGYDEMEFARIASKHFATRPHEYYLSPQDVVEAIPIIARAYDEPFGNASAVPTYYCAKLARADGQTTLLAGDGGDELFAGNERYGKQKVFEWYHQHLPEFVRHSMLEPLLFDFSLNEKIKLLAKAQSYVRQANIPLPDRLETYNFLNRLPHAKILTPDFLARIDPAEPLELLRDTYGRASTPSFLNRLLFVDLRFTLADSDLRKVNRMCELAQMEVRYPFLDEEVVRFSEKLPVSLKLKGLKLRYFFKHALRDFLPREILTKSKHGFGLPYGLWMNKYEPLRELTHDSLASIARRDIINPAFLQELEDLHRQHPSYYGVMMWVLMMLEQWFQSEEAN